MRVPRDRQPDLSALRTDRHGVPVEIADRAGLGGRVVCGGRVLLPLDDHEKGKTGRGCRKFSPNHD